MVEDLSKAYIQKPLPASPNKRIRKEEITSTDEIAKISLFGGAISIGEQIAKRFSNIQD
jgi:hypothetical protein